MKNIQVWTAAAVIVVLGACTTEATTGDDAGGGSSTTVTTGAAGSTTATTTGTGGGGTGGTGGSSGSDAGALCTATAGDSACRTCALQKCHDAVCGCEGNSACSAHLTDFYTCVSSSSTLDSCTSDFTVQSNGVDGGASWANDLSSCMGGTATADPGCEDTCKGTDAGPRR
jgi:hypothetical protein